jgi:hypothetical protein
MVDNTSDKKGEHYLTNEQNMKRKLLWDRITQSKKTNQVNVKDTFELMYLGLHKYIKNKSLVEGDLKELQRMLDQCADKMMEIIKKSKNDEHSTKEHSHRSY